MSILEIGNEVSRFDVEGRDRDPSVGIGTFLVTDACPTMEIISLPTSAVRGSWSCVVALASAELVL